MEALPETDGPPQDCEGSLQDTIPATLKQSIFVGKSIPDLCKDYDVLGFDADHCIVKYNIPNLTRLLTKITANDLHELYGYSEKIKAVPDEMMNISLNNMVWDIEHRTLLKLGEGKVIVQARLGSKRLDQSEIEAIYGSPPIFQPLNYPQQKSNLNQEQGAYMTMMTYFDCCKVPVIAHAIDLMEAGEISGKSNLEFAKDVIKSILRQYANFNNEEYHTIATYGDFFPTVLEDPSKIIDYQPELRKTLELIRSKGTKLFLGTNSHYEYMEVIMKATLGEDWQQLFDLNLANCRKPLFFRDESTTFYCVDESARDVKGTAVLNGSECVAHDSYLEGNAKLVNQFYERLLNKDQVRVCYFGDHFWSDVHASATYQQEGKLKWDSIVVLEELYWFDNGSSEGKDPLLLNMEPFWGDNFFFDTVNGQPVKNYFVAEVEKVARYAVPFLKNINRLVK